MAKTVCPHCLGNGNQIKTLLGGNAVIVQCTVCNGSGGVHVKVKEMNMEMPMNEVKATTKATPGDVLKGVGSQVADAFLEAGKQKIAAEVMAGVVTASKELAAKMGLNLPDNPMVDRLLGLGMPVLLMLAAQMLQSQAPTALPKGLLEGVNTAATYALQGVSKEAVNELAAVALPFALQIAALGSQALLASGGQAALNDGGAP